MTKTDWLETRKGGVYLRFRVQPRASKNEVAGTVGGSLKIKLTSPPVDGAANDALIRFISKKLAISRSEISILSGKKSRNKGLKITGISACDVIKRLGVSG